MISGAVSVIIPAYNRAGVIGDTLWSLLNQTVPAVEVIVVDDGSADETARVVERIAGEVEDGRWEIGGETSFRSSLRLPRLRLIRQENAGPGAARNRGFAEAKGEFIHFFDSDDIAAPNKHEVQLRALMETGADIAYGPWVKGRFVEDERPFGGKVGRWGGGGVNTPDSEKLKSWFKPVGPVLQARGLPEGDLVRALLTHWSIVPHACLFRRSIVEKSGGFPDDMTAAEDQMMFLRCLLSGAKVVHTPETIEFYRLGDEGKLTAQGEAQRKMALHWAEYLVRGHEDVTSGMWRVTSQNKPVTRDSLPATTTPSAWFGFRLRAYEAWKDLEKFFPGEEGELKAKLSEVGRFDGAKVGRCGGLKVRRWKYEMAGWWGRKVGGIKKRLMGYREHRVFRCARYSPGDLKL